MVASSGYMGLCPFPPPSLQAAPMAQPSLFLFPSHRYSTHTPPSTVPKVLCDELLHMVYTSQLT